jgi:aldoxime dehydratase
MESAIPEHLRAARTRHRRVPDDYVPPYPSFVARHRPSVQQVVMAYFGVQSQAAPFKAAEQAWIASRFQASGGPTHWDPTICTHLHPPSCGAFHSLNR